MSEKSSDFGIVFIVKNIFLFGIVVNVREYFMVCLFVC